ncbi:MAG TPA: HAD hydrolase family protein [Chthoniobacterales bacterium]
MSTDFDGTLIEYQSDGRCVPDLARILTDALREGTIWAVNTGRTLEHLDEGLAQFAAPVSPHFAIVNERYIFRAAARGWESLEPWNSRCTSDHQDLWDQTGGIFRQLARWCRRNGNVELVEVDGQLEGLITADEETMEETVVFLDGLRGQVSDFSWQRNSIYLRFAHRAYDKGSALIHLAVELGIPLDRVIAVGDHYNDLPMLNGTSAGRVACVANAVEEIKTAVLTVGGYVAGAHAGRGVAEALAYFKNQPAAARTAGD